MGASLQNKSRLVWLDFGKAMGILMVLLVHAECRLGLVTYYGGMFYMPIFFVAAGYTYRYRPEEDIGVYIQKKAKRVLFPYVVTSVFLWCFFWIKDCVLVGKPADLKLNSLMGILYSRNQMYAGGFTGENPVLMDILNAPLWFLTAIFLVYIWYELVNRSGKKYLLLGIGLLASVIWHYATELLLPWSLDAVPYFACFMAVGEHLREKNILENLQKKWYRVLFVLAVFVVLAHWNGSVNLSCGSYGKSMLVYLVIGSLGSALVFVAGVVLEKVCEPIVKLTGWIGQETMTILCFHMFLFMFIKTAGNILGLGSGLVKTGLVVGSLVVLTVAGRLVKKLNKR